MTQSLHPDEGTVGTARRNFLHLSGLASSQSIEPTSLDRAMDQSIPFVCTKPPPPMIYQPPAVFWECAARDQLDRLLGRWIKRPVI
jgi:hypothetical protein